MRSWAFYHGWAMGPWFFEPLAQALGGQHWFFDRGYTNHPTAEQPPGSGWTIVTHSMGLWQVPSTVLDTAEALVILGGFQTFVPQEKQGLALVRRNLTQMQRRLLTHPIEVIGQFLELCRSEGHPAIPQAEAYNLPLLAQDLEQLATGTWTYCDKIAKTVLIQGEQDKVVFPSQAQALAQQLNTKLLWVSETGHDCHYSQPAQLASMIQKELTS